MPGSDLPDRAQPSDGAITFEKRAESGIGSKLDELIRAESDGGFLVVPAEPAA